MNQHDSTELAEANVEGHFELVDPQHLIAWVWIPRRPEQQLDVTIHVNGRVLARVPSTIYRPDVHATGRGTGCYGLEFRFPAALQPRAGDVIALTLGDTGPHVPGSPRTVEPAGARVIPPVLREASDLFPEVRTSVERHRSNYPEVTGGAFWEAYEEASPYSLVAIPGFYNVYQTMVHIARCKIPGAFVECGCFLGGMAIFMARLRRVLGLMERQVLLFDTFEGFPIEFLDARFGEESFQYKNWLEVVRDNFERTIGKVDGIEFIEGPVEKTVPPSETGPLSLLRLDTDHYSSTKVELEHLYPRLQRGGGIIIDDYGTFQGARQATDEYLGTLAAPPLLNRINHGIWAGVKP